VFCHHFHYPLTGCSKHLQKTSQEFLTQKSQDTTSHMSASKLPHTTHKSRIHCLMILGSTPVSIQILCFTHFTTGKERISNILRQRHSRIKAGDSTSSTRHGFNDMKNQRQSRKILSKEHIVSLTTRAHGGFPLLHLFAASLNLLQNHCVPPIFVLKEENSIADPCFSKFRMNRRKADFKFAYKFLEDEV
jgi:hypothetical protein